MTVVLAQDATHENIAHLTPGIQSEGYTTGSTAIKWTDADWTAHPGAVRICQDAAGSDATADVYDVERYAGTNASAVIWSQKAWANRRNGVRVGQRWPAIYTSANNVTPLVNTLIGGGVKSGVYLLIADWGESVPAAASQVAAASGPFPVCGIQLLSGTYVDYNILSLEWLNDVTQPKPAVYSVTQPPPGRWIGRLSALGTGTDGVPWETSTVNGETWTTPSGG